MKSHSASHKPWDPSHNHWEKIRNHEQSVQWHLYYCLLQRPGFKMSKWLAKVLHFTLRVFTSIQKHFVSSHREQTVDLAKSYGLLNPLFQIILTAWTEKILGSVIIYKPELKKRPNSGLKKIEKTMNEKNLHISVGPRHQSVTWTTEHETYLLSEFMVCSLNMWM